jgi:ectonucleotide pyrophosphatase/phosphodiesterase family protein 5
MHIFRLILILWILFYLLGCATHQTTVSHHLVDDPKKPLVLLIGIDGFKPEYLTRGLTPTLIQLAQKGVLATGLIPAFPSVTFPNHYSIVTGLTPDHHGIVDNRMVDPDIPKQIFHYSSPESLKNPRWWEGATPIWVTAKQQGKISSTLFWPGSETLIHGELPDDFLTYEHSMPSMERASKLLLWLDRPDVKRADFATLYFSEVDAVGHSKGPNSVELNNALKNVDDAIKTFMQGLDQLGLTAVTSVVIVSDHGMAEVADHNVINLKSLLQDYPDAELRWTGAYGGIEVKAENVEAILNTLSTQRHFSCWQKANLPIRFKFGSHKRIPSIFCLAAQGWFVTDKAGLSPVAGMHGYDPALTSMHGLFIASGYRIQQQNTPLAPFNNIDLYPLLTTLLNIQPEPHDGDDFLVRSILKLP